MTTVLAWLRAHPFWATVAGTFLVTLLLCNTCHRPEPPNVAAITLENTRAAYERDTLRKNAVIDSLQVVADSQRLAKNAAVQKRDQAERRARAAEATVALAKAALDALERGTDTAAMYHAAKVVIVRQDSQIVAMADQQAASDSAFSRLTAELGATREQRDQVRAGLHETTDRLALAEKALQVELGRHSCSINLIVKRIGCPSRGAVAIVTAAVSVLGYRYLEHRKGT